jgi:hypothetical protein
MLKLRDSLAVLANRIRTLKMEVCFEEGEIVIPIHFPALIADDDLRVRPGVAMAVSLLRSKDAKRIWIKIDPDSTVRPAVAQVLLKGFLQKTYEEEFMVVDSEGRGEQCIGIARVKSCQ